jgi:hypothetical protein
VAARGGAAFGGGAAARRGAALAEGAGARWGAALAEGAGARWGAALAEYPPEDWYGRWTVRKRRPAIVNHAWASVVPVPRSAPEAVEWPATIHKSPCMHIAPSAAANGNGGSRRRAAIGKGGSATASGERRTANF